MDLEVNHALVIPAAELQWRFSRSSGPGGQHVNTSDSRAELLWDVANSPSLDDDQKVLLNQRLARKINNGVISVTASEQRSQLRNREIALEKLATMVSQGLSAPGPSRKATKPTRGSRRRHMIAKGKRSETKQLRRRPVQD